jgi:hypothetical protein
VIRARQVGQKDFFRARVTLKNPFPEEMSDHRRSGVASDSTFE